MRRMTRGLAVPGIGLLLATAAAAAAPTFVDQLQFGNEPSETAHKLAGDHSEVIAGGLDRPARRLLPATQTGWEGGRLAFDLDVAPDRPNYLTAKFWGGDSADTHLMLICEGKQVGYRHLGDVTSLDNGSEGPAAPGRFIFTTLPLPEAMTHGKTRLHFEIRSSGPTSGYSSTFEAYQKPMHEPTRGIYAVYTHVDGCFEPPADVSKHPAASAPPLRPVANTDTLDRLKSRVDGDIEKMLKDRRPLNQQQLWFLARAYHVRWTKAYRNPLVVSRAAEALDALFVAFQANPKIAEHGPSIYNGDWFGLGPAGAAVSLLGEAIRPMIDRPVAGADAVKRSAGWADMLAASRDYHRRERRQYTNQSMISDTFGLYECNRGLAVIAPSRAMPEGAVRQYLYQSAGLVPWLGGDTEHGSAKPLGDDFFQLTRKGLTRELGYVGYYGEVIDWLSTMYEATCPRPGETGDDRLLAQLANASHARLFFRYPTVDADGYRAMRIETIVGWRDTHFPGNVVYAQRPTWDASPVGVAALTRDLGLVGAAQQMFADGQFFPAVEEALKDKSLRTTAGLLTIPDDYATLVALPPTGKALPMSPGAGDACFADEDDGVVAVRRGDEVLYVSLYWRARFAVNGLARVHYITPANERIAVVRQETKYDATGLTYTRPDWTNFGFGNGGMAYPDHPHSAMAGEKLPIAKVPPGIRFKPGDENLYAGRGTFYTLRYGNYLIGMNMTADRTFDLVLPDGTGTATDLMTGKHVNRAAPLKVGPKSTAVIELLEGPSNP